MQGKIAIIGPIGSELDAQGNIISRGVELVDVMTQVQGLLKDEVTKEITIEISSPGGYVETGDQIAEYLAKVKAKGIKIITMQTGLIGSIATKAFLEGDERILNNAFKTVIHNPWQVVGAVDAKSSQAVTDRLNARKNDLLSYYVEKTKSDKSVLEPLMDNETALTAEQALTLGFGTSIVRTPAEKVFASIKPTMSKEKTATEKLLEDIKALFTTPAKASVELKTADGKVLTSDAADEAGLKGSAVTLDSQPAPDGQYKLVDGRNVTVAGGKISDVAAAADPVAARFEKLEGMFAELAGHVKTMAEANKTTTSGLVTQAKLDESLNTIKALIKGKHEPDKKVDGTKGDKVSPLQKYNQRITE